MASLGCRAFSGVTVRLLGALVGVHVSMALAATALFLMIALLFTKRRGTAA